ncbi:hypothetical protein GC096_30425 [Paenibacillus sp. LMG 31461]|uniref:SIR2-like domain-containing protein n=1 Tax=Paenibacillus plantarum TaxID=2654975 RepID=A0ABX1XJU3_9BACL|nr:SIR2 family protein [Paenibacillus plantarum]NOU68346.1 hypothetical protein [Paenibacillus plantarum]
MSFERLISGNKLPVLFIGSGFSRRYIDAPDWESLLIKIYEFIGKQRINFVTLKSRIKNTAEYRQFGDGEINAIIAEKIEKEFNDYFYESELVDTYSDWIEEGVNPFRKCISTIVNDFKIISEKEAELDVFKGLKNKVMSVITTNYDVLIETLFALPKENTFIGQPQLFSPDSLELGELYKIHGCITEPDNIVITTEDYNNFKENAKLFSAKLLTLISENPVVFIGYSINDPNIQQILTDLVRCLSHKQIESLKNHFYLIEYNQGNQELQEKEFLFRAKAYNGEETVFPISIISTDNYEEVYKRLSNLTPAMNISTVKQVKRIVRDIVVQSVESNQETDSVMTILMDDISKLSQSDQKFAIAIGNIRDINSAYGYNLRPIEDLLEDVLFDNKNFNNKRLIQETYEHSYLTINRILPIYKYSIDLSEQEIKQCPKVHEYLITHTEKNHYLNNGLITSLRSVPEGTRMEHMPEDYRLITWRKYNWIIRNFEALPLEEIKTFLQKEFAKYNAFDSNHKSSFRRLVSLYDLFMYKK